MKNSTLVFVHIHKTAGSTVRHALMDMFDKYYIIDSMEPIPSFENFKNLPENKRKKYDTIFGHYVLELIPYIHNPITFSYFRDPVDQFLSYYYYIKKSKWDYFHELANKYDVIDFAHKTIEYGFDNMQTRHLSKHTNHLIHHTSDYEHSITKDVYLKAENQLGELDYAFLTSQIDLSLVFFEYFFELKKRPYYASFNINKGRKEKRETSDKVKEQIREIQKWDIQLYEKVLQKNRDFLQKYPNLINEAELFTQENQNYYNKHKLKFQYKKYKDKILRKIHHKLNLYKE